MDGYAARGDGHWYGRYVLLVLPVEVFYRVKELAETFLQRIARAEEL